MSYFDIRDSGSYCEERIDPDPFTIGALILSAISASAAVVKIWQTENSQKRENKFKFKQLVHNGMLILDQLRSEVTYLQEIIFGEISSDSGAFSEEFSFGTTQVFLSHENIYRYKRVIRSLSSLCYQIHVNTLNMTDVAPTSSETLIAYLKKKSEQTINEVRSLTIKNQTIGGFYKKLDACISIIYKVYVRLEELQY